MARPPAPTRSTRLDRGVLPSLLGYALRRTQSSVFADFAATFARAGETLTPIFARRALVEPRDFRKRSLDSMRRFAFLAAIGDRRIVLNRQPIDELPTIFVEGIARGI